MIWKQLNQKMNSFSPDEGRVADFLRKNTADFSILPREVLEGKLHLLGEVFESFSQKMGYSGFEELQKWLQDSRGLSFEPMRKIVGSELGSFSRNKQMQLLFENEVQNLRKTLEDVDMASVLSFLELVKKCTRVFVAGFGVSRQLAQMMRYGLKNVISQPVTIISGSISDFIADLTEFQPQQSMILFAFPPYSKESYFLSRFVKERGGDLLLFSDSKECPFAAQADALLVCANHSLLFQNSWVPPMALSQVLISMLVLDRKMEGLKNIRDIYSNEKEGYTMMGEVGEEFH